MLSLTPSHFLALALAIGAVCWFFSMAPRLSTPTVERRELLVAPALLGLAGFVPIGAALAAHTSRADYNGAQATTLSWILLLCYLAVVAAIAVNPTRRAAIQASTHDKAMIALVIAYWCVGLVSDAWNGFAPTRISFYLVPLAFGAALLFRPNYRDALRLLMFGCFAACAASLALAAVRPSIAFTDPARNSGFLFSNRLAGVLEHPNAMGLVAAIGLLLGWRERGTTRALVVAVCTIALIGSDSRNSWVACAAAFGVMLAGSRPRGQDRLRPIAGRLVFGLTVVLLCAALASFYFGRSANGGTLDGRRAIWDFVLVHWKASPIIGQGPGVWNKLIAEGVVPSTVGQAHGQFFETLFTLGLTGVGLLIALVVVWSIKSIHAARRGEWTPLALELLLLAYGLLESPLSPWSAGATVWVFSLVLFLDPDCDAATIAARAPTHRSLDLRGLPQAPARGWNS
jgi:O-antigen ligase